MSLTSELVDRIGRGGWETEESGGRGGGDDDKTCLALLVECRRAFWAMDEVMMHPRVGLHPCGFVFLLGAKEANVGVVVPSRHW